MRTRLGLGTGSGAGAGVCVAAAGSAQVGAAVAVASISGATVLDLCPNHFRGARCNTKLVPSLFIMPPHDANEEQIFALINKIQPGR